MATRTSKTTIYLEPRQAKLLALIAGDQKTSQADLIRAAIDQLIEATVLPLPRSMGIAAEGAPPSPLDMREERRKLREHLDRKFPRHRESA